MKKNDRENKLSRKFLDIRYININVHCRKISSCISFDFSKENIPSFPSRIYIRRYARRLIKVLFKFLPSVHWLIQYQEGEPSLDLEHQSAVQMGYTTSRASNYLLRKLVFHLPRGIITEETQAD